MDMAFVEDALDQIRKFLLSETSLDSITDKVLKNSHQLNLSYARVAQAEENSRIESKSWMRSFTVGINLFGYSVVPATLDQESQAIQTSSLSNASVTLLLSPFDILTRHNRIKVARQEIEAQRRSMLDLRRQTKLFVTMKFLEYQEALETYVIQENNFMIAEEAKHIADVQFKQGRIDNEGYNKAVAGVLKYRADLLKAEGKVLKLKYELEILMTE